MGGLSDGTFTNAHIALMVGGIDFRNVFMILPLIYQGEPLQMSLNASVFIHL